MAVHPRRYETEHLPHPAACYLWHYVRPDTNSPPLFGLFCTVLYSLEIKIHVQHLGRKAYIFCTSLTPSCFKTLIQLSFLSYKLLLNLFEGKEIKMLSNLSSYMHQLSTLRGETCFCLERVYHTRSKHKPLRRITAAFTALRRQWCFSSLADSKGTLCNGR